MLRKDCTQGMTIDEIERVNREQQSDDHDFYLFNADKYGFEGGYALMAANSVYEYNTYQWLSLYRAAYEWMLSTGDASNDYELMTEEEEIQASSYLNAVLDEQSDRLVWTDKAYPTNDFIWAFQFRTDMFDEYFSDPKNKGSICFTGCSYGYIV